MPEVIFRSNKGVVFEKTTYKNGKCKLAVRGEDSGPVAMTYRYKDAPGLDSPYVNWGNLNCCNGWTYDEAYLYTAVQQGKKLLADITFSMFDEDWVAELKRDDMPTDKDVEAIIRKLEDELPGDCILGRDSDRDAYRSRYRYIYICKKGSVSDYINLDEVFNAYERLGITIKNEAKEKIVKACGFPLTYFKTDDKT